MLQLASSWLDQLVATIDNPQSSALIERDVHSGRAILRLPLPDPDQLRRLADLLQQLRPDKLG